MRSMLVPRTYADIRPIKWAHGISRNQCGTVL